MKRLIPWFGIAVILVVIFGTMYVILQQFERSDANSPQIQLAEDTAAMLNQGTHPMGAVGGYTNISTSLASFIIIYDKSGRVVAGSGYLNGVIPAAPIGVLLGANSSEYHAVTWQPQAGTRIAAVSVAANKYYVLSGRSLRLVEAQEDRTLQLAMVGCIISLLFLAVLAGCKLSTHRA
jgi:hypothetical protein